jgi:hypothetical protein
LAVDPNAAADLSVAADPNAAVDPNAVGDRFGEAAHTSARNAVVGDRFGEAVHTSVQIAVAADRFGEAAQTSARNAVVGDRFGEAAHTSAQIAVAADRYEEAAQTAEAVLNVAAAQNSLVGRTLAAVRNEPAYLIAVRNAAMNAAQIFPSAQLDRVSMFLRADRKAQNAETRIALDC